MQTSAPAPTRLRVPLPVCARAHPSARALTVCARRHPSTRAFTRLRPCAPVCARPYRLRASSPVYARPYPSVPACIRLRASSPVCARPLASARALLQHGFRFDMSASLKLPIVKKKMVKKILHADVRLKRMDGQVCPSVRVLNRHPNLHVRLVRQPWRPVQESSTIERAILGSPNIPLGLRTPCLMRRNST